MGTVEPNANSTLETLPSFWDLLSEQDKNDYKSLKLTLDANSGKRNRGHRIEAFDNILDAIRRYAERSDENDWKRFLVCGLCWMENMVAINTRQLRLLISKCKSSINGSFQKLGFTTNQSHTESWKFLFDRIPLLKDNFNELRQWTIRCRNPEIKNQSISITDAQITNIDSENTLKMNFTIPQYRFNVIIPQQYIENNPQKVLISAQCIGNPNQIPQDIRNFEQRSNSPQNFKIIQQNNLCCPVKFRKKISRQNSYDLR